MREAARVQPLLPFAVGLEALPHVEGREGLARHVGLEPRPRLLAEGLLLGGVRQVHAQRVLPRPERCGLLGERLPGLLRDPLRGSLFDSLPGSRSGSLPEKSASRFSTKASAGLLRVRRRVELEGEALLEAVALLDVEQLDAVERPLGEPHRLRGLFAGDFAGEGQRLVAQLLPGHHRLDCTEPQRLPGVDRLAGVEHPPGLLHAHQAHQVGGGAEGAAIDLRQGEGGVLRADHDVGGARDPDATADAVAVDRGDHGDRAVVDGREGVVAAPVHVDDLGCRRPPAP